MGFPRPATLHHENFRLRGGEHCRVAVLARVQMIKAIQKISRRFSQTGGQRALRVLSKKIPHRETVPVASSTYANVSQRAISVPEANITAHNPIPL